MMEEKSKEVLNLIFIWSTFYLHFVAIFNQSSLKQHIVSSRITINSYMTTAIWLVLQHCFTVWNGVGTASTI